MAVYNELQVGRYVRFLQKFLSIKGRQPAPLQYSGEISSFLSLFHGAENRYLEGWDRFGFSFTATAVAAQVTDIRVRNPGTSGVVAVVEKLFLREAAADNPLLGINIQSTDFPSVQNVSGSRLDARGRPAPNLIFSSGNNVSFSGTANLNIGLLANTDREVILTDDQELTILPGDAMSIVASTVNQAIAISMIWRERSLEESERS